MPRRGISENLWPIEYNFRVDEELLTLRQQALAAGQKHDQALIYCGDVLMGGDYYDAQRAVRAHTQAAKHYALTLAQLGLHLSKFEETSEMVNEGRRVRKLLDLLDREVETVIHRLEILKNHGPHTNRLPHENPPLL